MGSRKKKNEKRQQKRKEKHKQDRARKAKLLRQGTFEGDVIIVPSPGGAEKMSEVLMEFLEPYSGQWRTEEDLRKLLSVAIIAWNAALVTGGKRSELIESTLEALPPEVRPDARAIIEEMIRRKETFFANNHRMIVDYELTMGPAGPHLSVISTFENL